MTTPSPLEDRLYHLSFDELPADHRVTIYGVEYARLLLSEGGELFLTRTGWARLPALLPEHWFMDKKYLRAGRRLAGGTGNAFRVPAPAPTKQDLRLVVKFARSGQDVPLKVATTFPSDVPEEEIVGARWNSPFEEFGLLHDLRRGRFDAPELKILTKRPLAVYCPPSRYKDWQLNRSAALWHRMEAALQHAQKLTAGEPVHLHASRIYIMLFEWVEGQNAEECCKAGLITEDEMRNLTLRVEEELKTKGFRVLDNKPRHFILRLTEDGEVLRRNGRIVYALVDFELLKRTEACERWHRARKEEASQGSV